MKQSLLKHKKLFLMSFVCGVFFLSAAVSIILYISPHVISPLADTGVSSRILAGSSEPENVVVPSPNESTLGIVLFGYGGIGHDGAYLTDAIQVLYADFDKGTLALVSIPRDLWVKLPNGTESKINAAVVNSSQNNKDGIIKTGVSTFKKMLTDITGIQVDYFVSGDFVGYQRAIGINLNGIEVEVTETLDDSWYPIQGEEVNICGMSLEEVTSLSQKYSGFELERQFPCRYEHLIYKKGTVHMEGGDALKYVRSRHGSTDGDISRGRRQQEVLAAIRKKLFSLSALDKLPGFYNEIIKNTQTDISLDIINFLVPALKKSQDFQMITINLSTTNVLSSANSKTGGAIIIPKAGMFNWNEIRELIKKEVEKK